MAGAQLTTGPVDPIGAALQACEAIAQSRDPERALELGARLEREHARVSRVLLAIARMYVEAGLPADAKRATDAAGRALAAAAYDPTPILEISEDDESLPHFSLPDLEPPEPAESTAPVESQPRPRLAPPPRLTSSVPPPPRKHPSSAPPPARVTLDDFDDFDNEEDLTVVNLPKVREEEPLEEESSLPRFSMPSSVTESGKPYSLADEEKILHHPPSLAPTVTTAPIARHYQTLKEFLGRLRLWKLGQLSRLRSSTLKLALAAAAALVLVGWVLYAYLNASARHEAARQRLDQADELMTSLSVEDLRAADDQLQGSFEPDGVQAIFGGFFEGFEDLEPRAAALRARRQFLLSLIDPNGAADLKPLLDAAAKKRASLAELAAPHLFVAVHEQPEKLRELLKTWDPKLERDALYQLAAGIALDRLGDARSLERYDAARKLNPKLSIAEALYTQAALLQKDPSEAEPEVSKLRERSRAEPALVPLARALAALGWALRDDRGPVPSEQSELQGDEQRRLPPALTPARLAVDLVLALQDNDNDDVEARAQRALRIVQEADTPVLATALGKVAFGMGRDTVAERALSRVRALTERYPPASVIQAELDLLNGRFQAAKQAIDGAGSAVEANAVQAVIAYERLDLKNLEKNLAGLDAARFAALRLAPGVLTGEAKPSADELASLGRSRALWASLVAVDAALDAGRLQLAERLIADFPTQNERPLMLLRSGRLKRYQNHLQDSVKLTALAYQAVPESGRALVEHTFALVAAGRAEKALSVVRAKPPRDEPEKGWLEGFLVGKKDGWVAGSIKIGFLRLPDGERVALPWRLAVARALATAGDPRAYGYLEKLSQTAAAHPDLIAAKNEL